MTANPNVVFRVLGDGAVLVDLSTNQIYELNETGTAIWERLSRGEAADVIVDGLVAHFDVTAATAREQLSNLVTDLQSRGLLVP